MIIKETQSCQKLRLAASLVPSAIIIPVPEARTITFAVTGASGSIYAVEMLRALAADTRVTKINFVASENSLRVFAEELHLSGRNDLAEKLLDAPCPKLQQHTDTDIGANIASGSYPTDAMIILPCSMGTLAAIANGLASNLIQRAADVCLKERRPLEVKLCSVVLAPEGGPRVVLKKRLPRAPIAQAATVEARRQWCPARRAACADNPV